MRRDPVSKVAPLRAKLKKGEQAPGVLAEEPEFFVDLQKAVLPACRYSAAKKS